MPTWPDDSVFEFTDLEPDLANQLRRAFKAMPMCQSVPTRDDGYVVKFQGDLEAIVNHAIAVISENVRDNQEFALEFGPDSPFHFKYSLSRMTGAPGDSKVLENADALNVVLMYLGEPTDGRILGSVLLVVRPAEDWFASLEGIYDDDDDDLE